MDPHYDSIGAATALEDIASERREILGARDCSAFKHLADIDASTLSVVEYAEGRKNWRLCTKRETVEEMWDELVVRAQGIVTRNNLVPKNLRACMPDRAHRLTQQIQVCGLDTPSFNACVAKLDMVQDLFAQQLAGIDLVPLAELRENTGDSLVASNRVFTFHSDDPTQQDNEFQPGVDPLGLLAKFKTGTLIHAPDNTVRYYKFVPESGVYEGTVPGAFRIGDIVEIQVCFVALKTFDNKVKMMSRLASLALLDDQFSKAAAEAKRKARVLSSQVKLTAIRRRVGYFAEDEEEERAYKRSRASSPAQSMQYGD